MPRASTPLDPLEPLPSLEANNSIPVNNQPWFSVGQIVGGVKWVNYGNYSYYLKQLVRKQGKHVTRKILDFVKRGKQLEYSIAGIKAWYAQPTSSVSNQCYLQDGQCHSGLSWRYQVLLKGRLHDRDVCVIPQIWVSERNFIPLTEQTFEPKAFYKSQLNSVYKCVLQGGELAFVYVGHVKDDGRLSWDNHRCSLCLTPWERRSFQPYTLPDNILY